MIKTRLLTAASALVAGLTLATASSATAGNVIYGTGASLTGPFLDQIEGCYGPASPLDVQNSSGPASPGTTQTYTTCKKPNQTVNALRFMSSSSGYGEAAIYSNAAAAYAGETSTGSVYPGLEYAVSDYGLNASELAAYACPASVTCSVGSGATGVTVAGHLQPTPVGGYQNPLDHYGAVVQFPLLITNIVIVYNPVYKSIYTVKTGKTTSYSFNVQHPNKDKSGGLQLDVPTLCAIFNGQITNWNDPAITAQNGGVSLKAAKDPGAFSVPIELVGRSDSAGATAILYRAFAAQCGQGSVNYAEGGDSITYTNQYLPAGGKTLPSGLIGPSVWPGSGPTEPVVTGKFTTTKGIGNQTLYVALEPVVNATTTTAVQGKIGYVGPEYALPYAVKTATPGGKVLNIVDVVVPATVGGAPTVAIEPTFATALAAFNAVNAAPPTGAQETSQLNWAETIAVAGSPQANPGPNLYPFFGTSNFYFYTCYANAGAVTAIDGFLKYYYTSAETKTLLNQNGLAQLPPAWGTAILGAFVTGDSNNLKFTTTGTAPQCGAATITGAI
jgi:ABC-type phosphate transport system substrate-binding protein